MNEKSVRPFGVKDQLGYVFGDMAGSFVNLICRCLFFNILHLYSGDFTRMDGWFVFSSPSLGCD